MSPPTWLENGVRNNLWNLAISLAVSLIFFAAARRRAISAYSERTKRAHDEVVRIVETRLVNGMRINAAELAAFIRAVCRQYDVSPQRSLTNASVLEDVHLRIESSPHLNVQQKTEYAAQVSQTAAQVSQTTALTGNDETSGVLLLPVAPTLVKLVGRLQSGVSREGLLSIIEVVESAAIQCAGQCPSRVTGTGILQALSEARSRIGQNEDVGGVSRSLVEPILALAASAEPLLSEEAVTTMKWTLGWGVTMLLISLKYPRIWIFFVIASAIAFGVWVLCWDWISQRFFQGRGALGSRPGFGR